MPSFGVPFAALLVSLLNGYGAYAQGTNATCMSGFEWMSNSRNQNPCLMAAWLNSACLSDPTDAYVYSLPEDYHYRPPTLAVATPCQCSTVFYSMIGACAACQTRENLPWSAWDTNCSTVYVDVYPMNIPAGTAVPAWAYLDVTAGDAFNVNAAHALANQEPPESTASPITSATSSQQVSFSSSSSPGVTAPPAPSSSSGAPHSGDGGSGSSSSSSSKTNVGAIVGGVVGGIGGAAIIAGLIAWLVIRNKHKGPNSGAPLAGQAAGNTPPATYREPQTAYAGGVPSPVMSPPPGSVYNPDDPFNHPTQSPYGISSPSSPSHFSSAPSAQPSYQTGRYTGAPEV